MVSRIQAETGDYDIILIGVGGNDCTGQGDLGAYYDSDKTTFCGALNVLRSTIVQKWIGAEIFYLIPQKNVLSEDTYPRPIMLNVYRSAIVSACNKFNWHMIDTMCGLPQLDPSNPTIKSTYMPDGIHPSTAYAQIYCNYVLKKLISGGDSRIGKNIELKHYSINSDDGITGDVYLRVDPEANIEVCVHLNIPANVTAGNKVIISDFPTAYFDNYSMETYGNVNGVWTPLQMFVTIAAATGLPSLFVGVPPHSAVINTYSSKMKTLPNVKWMTDGSY